MDLQIIRQWWDVFKNNGQLTEIRILDGKKTYSGYYKNIDNIIRDISKFEDANVYFTLNAIDEACYGRVQNEHLEYNPKITTSDNDIVGRDFIMVDIDPVRKSGTNSSDEELEYAHLKCVDIYKFLINNGFYEPIVAMSGNGYHLHIPVAMKNTQENTEIVKRFLASLAMMFSDEHCDIDLKVFNSARICKLFGTKSNKGANIPTRPKRYSRIIKVPNEIKINDNEYIKKVASLYPDEPKPDRTNNYSTEVFDLAAFIERHQIKVSKIEKVSGGTKYILEHCLFNESHNGKDAMIFQRDNGAIAYCCLHSSCAHHNWQEVRKMYEPNAYEKKSYNNPRRFTPIQQKIEVKEQEKDEKKGNVWQCLSEIEDEDRSRIVSIPSGIAQYDKECCGFDKPSLSIWSGNNGCVDCDTEFFNGTQWKKISDYKDGDKVLQYNADGTASLVYPKMYHKYPCSMLTFIQNKTRSINQCLSDEHNLVYITSKGNLYKKNFLDFKKNNGCGCYFIPHFSYSGKGIGWTDDEIKLGLAVSAEGHLFSHRKNYVHRVRINLKHEYKKIELELLLNKLGIKYDKKKYNPKDLQFDSYLFYWDKSFKTFPAEWYNVNERQRDLIIENVTKWDGRTQKGRGGEYSSTIKQNADFIQYMVSASNHRCSMNIDNRSFRKNPLYIVKFCKNSSLISCSKGMLTFKDYPTKDGFKYCFTVDSGMLVLRRNNTINITGNSAKTTLLNQIALNAVNRGFKVAIYSGELRGKRIKRWLLYQAAGKTYNVKSQYNDYDYYTPQRVKDKIVEWLDDKLFNYNTQYSHNIEQVCKEIENIVKSKKVDMVIMDNLSCLDIADLDSSLNEQQKAAIKLVLRLANEYNVALHIVVHPKKSTAWLLKEDVSGSKTITDLADNVFLCQRWNLPTQKAAKEYLPKEIYEDIIASGATNLMQVIKHREFGDAEGHIYKLYFETESRRLKNSISEHIIYGWLEQPVEQTFVRPQIADDYSDSNIESTFADLGNNAPF